MAMTEQEENDIVVENIQVLQEWTKEYGVKNASLAMQLCAYFMVKVADVGSDELMMKCVSRINHLIDQARKSCEK